MTTKRTNPYTALVERCRQYAFNVKHRHRKTMFTYPKVSGDQTGYRLDDLYQRVAAADQLGYDVELVTCANGDLQVQYVRRVEQVPYEINPD